MAKEKDFSFVCKLASVSASTYNTVEVSVEDCNISKFMEDMDGDVYNEMVAFIGGHNTPDEVFDAKDLIKWAEENGYTKENN